MHRWSPGDAIVLRELWRGRVFAARPATVVGDTPGLMAFFVPARVPCGVPVGDDGRELRLPDGPWHLEVRERGSSPVLSFSWPTAPYAVLRWSTRGETVAWYVNLQDPLRRTAIGFDTTDHVLDAIVDLDGTWRWKDEAELAQAVERGLFTPDDAATFRVEGERAIGQIQRRESPFDRDWASWNPDPAWSAPSLPDGWDRP
jgi:hypothetical protein